MNDTTTVTADPPLPPNAVRFHPDPAENAPATTPPGHTATSSAPPPRITKFDRVALAAVHIATALPGQWTIGRGCGPDDAADIECLSTGARIALCPWGHRTWGFRLVPCAVPRELVNHFVWPREDDKNAHPGFAVGTPAAEVATYIHEDFLPRYHHALARAEAAKRECDQAEARRRVARAQVAERLHREFSATASERARCQQPVTVHYQAADDLVRIDLVMPLDDAIACTPALARALTAPVDDNHATECHR
ncbi:hypothetical protein [Amycolatopsis sp. 195334CR]|uniref:hypothetical protein n=1 Tax=Amycolatopsis sp. 195334CR TaxID=2814588 RepID=UPI001A8F4ED9|nr:hypothetical protein [Amycolatopsis sp. 195334CR]MBN6034147.1 hypothetical protein [Amycolatopsis sp. 195334CR]